MSKYLTAEVVSAAVRRLADAAVKSTLAEFLIGQRALVLAGTDSVGMGMTNEPFMRALKEVSECSSPGATSTWHGQPFFSPFGAATAAKGGFKGPKYVTNGAANTLQNWNMRPGSPYALLPGTRPMEIRRVEGQDAESLRAFFARAGGTLPGLLDSAIWWLRAVDLDEATEGDSSSNRLKHAFREAFGLGDLDATALFLDDLPEDEIHTAEMPADPCSYLPAPAESTSKVPMIGIEADLQSVLEYIRNTGIIYQPWQVATFVTAVRTKPFVILAGISGTGKTKMARLVAEATGSSVRVVPVRPDWTDSSELIGYERISGAFVAGSLLTCCQEAEQDPDRQHFLVLDEMNLARVEYYLAEVLSLVEERQRSASGSIVSQPLAPQASAEYSDVRIPENLCIVGSVNMDETTHGFSRKVLDRAFVIELSDFDLSQLPKTTSVGSGPIQWEAAQWRQPYMNLAECDVADPSLVSEVVQTLTAANSFLEAAQLQVGFRVRDEIVIFCTNARGLEAQFVDDDGNTVRPLDLALAMKVLPRIQGSGATMKRVLEGLHGLAVSGPSSSSEPGQTGEPCFPVTASRITSMLQQLEDTGFTSYWL